jgi:hypothetical protein
VLCDRDTSVALLLGHNHIGKLSPTTSTALRRLVSCCRRLSDFDLSANRAVTDDDNDGDHDAASDGASSMLCAIADGLIDEIEAQTDAARGDDGDKHDAGALGVDADDVYDDDNVAGSSAQRVPASSSARTRHRLRLSLRRSGTISLGAMSRLARALSHVSLTTRHVRVLCLCNIIGRCAAIARRERVRHRRRDVRGACTDAKRRCVRVCARVRW